MNILNDLLWRYATKKFDSTEKISKEQLDTLKEAFNLTATSYGLQPIKMLVIENKELRENLVPISYGQRQVVDASHLLVICIQKDYTVKDVEAYFELVKKIRNTPDVVIDPFKKNVVSIFSNKPVEDIQQASKFQAYLALGNLLTVCAALKIDSCPMEGFIPEKLDEILNLNELNLQSVLLLPVGIRASDDPMSGQKKVRKPISESVIEL
ncbi:NAD(P)H-dependent oxidoreductase [Flavicella sediminum]|uniref:NAD(P)H-dependent oxidoreductase n=1 Tax=Flavicella sediminum TaxID=2585141 RepID=UPI001122419F|nr:NAD(P)H-dependent oxidoreductase [Flavicella sediminum]